MQTKNLMAFLVLILMTLAFSARSESKEVTELQVNSCWNICTKCMNRSQDKNMCLSMNEACCAGQDKRGIYKACGCW